MTHGFPAFPTNRAAVMPPDPRFQPASPVVGLLRRIYDVTEPVGPDPLFFSLPGEMRDEIAAVVAAYDAAVAADRRPKRKRAKR